jgi:hypothetical protein
MLASGRPFSIAEYAVPPTLLDDILPHLEEPDPGGRLAYDVLMHAILRWLFVGLGSLLFLAGFPIIRFRIRLAAWQQARNEDLAWTKSGLFGPGRTTPRTELVLGILFVVFGAAFALGNLFFG